MNRGIQLITCCALLIGLFGCAGSRTYQTTTRTTTTYRSYPISPSTEETEYRYNVPDETTSVTDYYSDDVDTYWNEEVLSSTEEVEPQLVKKVTRTTTTYITYDDVLYHNYNFYTDRLYTPSFEYWDSDPYGYSHTVTVYHQYPYPYWYGPRWYWWDPYPYHSYLSFSYWDGDWGLAVGGYAPYYHPSPYWAWGGHYGWYGGYHLAYWDWRHRHRHHDWRPHPGHPDNGGVNDPTTEPRRQSRPAITSRYSEPRLVTNPAGSPSLRPDANAVSVKKALRHSRTGTNPPAASPHNPPAVGNERHVPVIQSSWWFQAWQTRLVQDPPLLQQIQPRLKPVIPPSLRVAALKPTHPPERLGSQRNLSETTAFAETRLNRHLSGHGKTAGIQILTMLGNQEQSFYQAIPTGVRIRFRFHHHGLAKITSQPGRIPTPSCIFPQAGHMTPTIHTTAVQQS